MWEDEYKRNFMRRIILIALIVVILGGLAAAMLVVHKRTERQDAQLVEAYTQQQEKQTAARQEAVDAINAEYEKDMQTVREYLPGIVCWGDSITAGSSGNVSYPYVLQKYIDAYICDIYDFRSSIDNAEDYARLKWDDYKVDIPVVNMGGGPEDTNTILGRCGVVPYVVSADFTIPAECEAVEVMLQSQNGKPVSPLTGGSVGVNNVTINGIEGVLSLDSDSYKSYNANRYFFTRSEAGSAEQVSTGTVIKTAATDMYKDYIHVICIGTYGGFDTTDELVQQTKELVARQTNNSDRYIILGLCSTGGYWNIGATFDLDVIDTAMMQAFGNHYINVRKYLCEDGLSDAGLRATAADEENIKYNIVPESFRSPSGNAELNGKAYSLVGKLVYDRMDSLGYFDEVLKELYIKETTRQLLKDDPDYLNRVIANSLK